MKDTGRIIRKAVFQALSSISVNVYDSAAPATETGNYVIIRNEGENDARDNAFFRTEGTLLLDIHVFNGTSVNTETIETIADEITTTLQPTVKTSGITLEAGFHLEHFRRLSSNYIPTLQTEVGKLTRKVLRYEYQIQEL